MKMLFICHILSVYLLLNSVVSVDRSNFKTCEQSRNRVEYDKFFYKVDKSSLRTENNILQFNLFCKERKKLIHASISLLDNDVFRLEMIDDKTRYRIPHEDIFTKKFKFLPAKQILNDDYLMLEGPRSTAVIMLDDFKLKIYVGNELIVTVNDMNKLNIEDETYFKPENSTDYSETFKSHTDSRVRGPESLSLDVTFHNKEFTYGIPEHADSFALKNTDNTDPYRLYNLDVFEYELDNPMALYGSVPVIFSSNGINSTGIYWNNPTETWVDIKSTRKSNSGILSSIFSGSEPTIKSSNVHWMSESGIIDLFIMPGPNPFNVSRQYADLTGTTPLPPLFSIGYHQCRWNYNSQDDIISVDSNFDKYNIPVDVLWLDIEHTNGKRYFTWDTNKFPDPGKMVDDLMVKKRRLVTVVDPHIKSDSGYHLYNEGKSHDLFIKDASGNEYSGWCWPGSSAYPDFTDPRMRKLWSEQFLKYDPVRENTMFSWNDMGEPSVFSGPEITMHKDAKHFNGFEHRDVHNTYGLYVHLATWEGQLLRSNNKKRPFVLTRAFFAGSQRTSAVWTGDNKADWSHLKASLPMLLSLSITGITFCGADVGGFFNNPSNDLLIRWYQAGAFQPFFRAHAHIDTSRREPWLFGEETTNLIREAIQARYLHLPYWYTQFYLSEISGSPIMAPLWYYFQDSNLLEIETSYTIGKDILVSPVVTESETTHLIHLPVNETWYESKHFTAYSNVPTVSMNVDMSTIPVFYRAGSIIPIKERFRRSSSISLQDPYSLMVFVDGKTQTATGKLFIDDGETINDSNASLVNFSFTLDSNQDTGKLSSSIDSSTSSFYAKSCELENITIVGNVRKPETIVKVVNNERIPLRYTMTSNKLKIQMPMIKLDGNWIIEIKYSNEKI